MRTMRVRQWVAGWLSELADLVRGGDPKSWCLIYGPERAGTSLMLRLVGMASRRMVGDWGLGALLQLTPDYDYITFDRKRALRDLSRNILDNAAVGSGTSFDLAYKQASLEPDEYGQLVGMWGPPKLTIFCLRRPAGYIASARRKFSEQSLADLQTTYIRALRHYEEIGGRIFEYSREVTNEDYAKFLSPYVSAAQIERIRFKGTLEPENVTAAMRSSYLAFCSRHAGAIHPRGQCHPTAVADNTRGLSG